MACSKKLLKISGKILVVVAGIILSYFLIACLFSLVPASGEKEEEGVIDIFIVGSGVHTDIVMPASTSFINWHQLFTDRENPIPASLRYMAIGWGNKEFYLNTPEWSDLTFKTAFNAVCGRGDAILHVAWYSSIREDEHCVRLSLSADQYERLIRYIKSYLPAEGELVPVPSTVWYGKYHRFYDAGGHYSLFLPVIPG